jgi:hypothetical protein
VASAPRLSTENGIEPDTFSIVLAACWYQPHGNVEKPSVFAFWIPALGTIPPLFCISSSSAICCSD